MDAHLIDSRVFGHLWSTDASREAFGERARIMRWVETLGGLARAQARLDLIPSTSAAAITELASSDIDIDAVAAETRLTGHSTLGLIHVLQALLPEAAREHIYLGVTVQDITDTSLALEMRTIGNQVRADLVDIENVLIELASGHRTTLMAGRTHGQPGAPITFGFKVASWLDEVGRHIARLDQTLERVLVAQLGGAVGTLAFFGDQALALRVEFCAEVGLREPPTSWLTSRDRLAEFASVLALVTATTARIANEVYSLQRLELSEVFEAVPSTVVGSITMPHKRNPESSEQIVVLARLVRAQASTLCETMVQEHERDARGWKTEWVAFPELCHFATASLALTKTLVSGLEIDVDRMRVNVQAVESITSEQVLRHLTPLLGKHRAQAALHDAYRIVRIDAVPLGQALTGVLGAELSAADIDAADIDAAVAVDQGVVGAAAEMTDVVIAAALSRRSADAAIEAE